MIINHVNHSSSVSPLPPTTIANPTNKNDEGFQQQLRESEIKAEIAIKATNLPHPQIMVHPKAIARMAKDQKFYDKVMSKIDSYTSDTSIINGYPDMTASLLVEEDGEWIETRVDEVLKAKDELASKDSNGNKSIFDLLDTTVPNGLLQNDELNNVYTDIDYTNVLIDAKKRIYR